MNDLVKAIGIHLEMSGTKFNFDGKFFHLYSQHMLMLEVIESVAGKAKQVYGIKRGNEYMSFRCDNEHLRTQLIDLVIKSKGL